MGAEPPIGQAIRAYIEHQFLSYPYDIYPEEIKKSMINFFTNSIKKIKEVFEDAYQIADLFVNILEGQYAQHNIKPREQEKKSEEKQDDKENKAKAKEEKLKVTEELTQEEKEEVRNAMINWDLKKIKRLSKQVVNLNEFYSLVKSKWGDGEEKHNVLYLLFWEKSFSYQVLHECRNISEFKGMESLPPDKREYLGIDLEGIFLNRGYPGVINCEELRVENLEKIIHAYFNQADIRFSASATVLSARKQLVRQYIPALALAYQSTVEKIKQITDLLFQERRDINDLLAEAVISGNIELAVHALDRGADVNFVPPDSKDKGCPRAFKLIIFCCEDHGTLTSNKLLEIFFRKGIASEFVKELSDRIDREIQYFKERGGWGAGDPQKLLAVTQLKKQLEEHSKLQKERLDSRAAVCFGLFRPQPRDCALHAFANSPIFDKSLVSLLFKF